MDKKVIGIIIFVVLIVIIAGIYIASGKNEEVVNPNTNTNVSTTKPENIKGLTTVYVATGGGKEKLIEDERVLEILKTKYKLNVFFDTWSNGKTILWPLVREAVGNGNVSYYDVNTSTIHDQGLTKYDALFTSDQRFYDYYQLPPDKSKGEADRYTMQGGSLTLNTPIVIYSWKEVVDALIKEEIVSINDGIHYITDMPKLMEYILEGKKWKDIGLENFGQINIGSTDPVSSSPGATYYGLLLSILCDGEVNDENIKQNLPKLKTFYEKSGYMNNKPADLFERYLIEGMGAYPMIVDYEKSLIDFSESNPEVFESLKDKVVILYPAPTIWNSHCYEYFTDNGKLLFEALTQDEEIQQIAWEKCGFRIGVTGGNFDTSKLGIAIPSRIISTVPSLKMNIYNKLIDYLGAKTAEEAEQILNDK